jgi:predicted protein tyrosine phosphatase
VLRKPKKVLCPPETPKTHVTLSFPSSRVLLVADKTKSQAFDIVFITWGEFDSKPDGHWHDAMMDDVERADLIILFSQNEKKLLSNKYRKLFVKFPSRLLTVSMNSVNFEKKYHHEACTICN